MSFPDASAQLRGRLVQTHATPRTEQDAIAGQQRYACKLQTQRAGNLREQLWGQSHSLPWQSPPLDEETRPTRYQACAACSRVRVPHRRKSRGGETEQTVLRKAKRGRRRWQRVAKVFPRLCSARSQPSDHSIQVNSSCFPRPKNPWQTHICITFLVLEGQSGLDHGLNERLDCERPLYPSGLKKGDIVNAHNCSRISSTSACRSYSSCRSGPSSPRPCRLAIGAC